MDIKTLNDINIDTDEGKLLFMAVARLSTSIDKDKTPDEIINHLVKLNKELRE